MHPIFTKTFGGLTSQYYFRQFFFGLLIPAFSLFMLSRSKGSHPMHWSMVAFFILNAFLYPYSRFVYEGVVNFFLGRNVVYGNFFLMMFLKGMTMVLCWGFAVFIAPIGLVYLYFHHSRA